jgi:hypothetical protein
MKGIDAIPNSLRSQSQVSSALRLTMLLNSRREAEGYVTQCHGVTFLPSRKGGWETRSFGIESSLISFILISGGFMSICILLRRSRGRWKRRDRSRVDRKEGLCSSSISVTPESLHHQEGVHGLRPVAVVLTVKDGDE